MNETNSQGEALQQKVLKLWDKINEIYSQIKNTYLIWLFMQLVGRYNKFNFSKLPFIWQ